jgi:hypothetical protein
MSTRRLIITLCLAFLFTESSVLCQKRLAPLPVKEALKTLNLSMFTPLDVSSDGQLVAYVLQDTNRKAQTKTPRSAQDLEALGIPSRADYSDIWITETATGVSRNLTKARVRAGRQFGLRMENTWPFILFAMAFQHSGSGEEFQERCEKPQTRSSAHEPRHLFHAGPLIAKSS